jgi:hypothetical protein
VGPAAKRSRAGWTQGWWRVTILPKTEDPHILTRASGCPSPPRRDPGRHPRRRRTPPSPASRVSRTTQGRELPHLPFSLDG